MLRVVAISDQDCLDENGNEQEQLGINRCLELFQGGIWKQTSYNTFKGVHANGKTPFRKNYACTGHTYDAQRDAFIQPQPDGEGWILDEDMCIWRNPAQEEADAVREAIRQQNEMEIHRV